MGNEVAPGHYLGATPLDRSWLRVSKEIHVGTAVRDNNIDNGPPLFGELIYLCEAVGLSVFQLRHVVSRAAASQE